MACAIPAPGDPISSPRATDFPVHFTGKPAILGTRARSTLGPHALACELGRPDVYKRSNGDRPELPNVNVSRPANAFFWPSRAGRCRAGLLARVERVLGRAMRARSRFAAEHRCVQGPGSERTNESLPTAPLFRGRRETELNRAAKSELARV
jgi:hypothetical protein